MKKEILVKVRHKADGLFHGVCPGLFGFRIVTKTAQDMMAEAPKFAKIFFGDGIEVNITYEWSGDKIVFHFVVEEDEVGFKARCIERPEMGVWGATIPKLIESITLSGARVINQDFLPAELCSVRIIRPLKHIKAVLEPGTTGNIAKSPDMKGFAQMASFGDNQMLREECCETVKNLLEASDILEHFDYIIDFEDLT